MLEAFMTREDYVRAFHDAFRHQVDGPLTGDAIGLHLGLMTEEFGEVTEAILDCAFDLERGESVARHRAVHLLKELADLQYTLSGFAVAFGLDLEEAFHRVHQSNMSKLDEDGGFTTNNRGKVLKPDHYQPPFLEDLV